MDFRDREPTPSIKGASAARQGVTGHNVRYVLGFSMVGVIAAFIGVALIYGVHWPI